jgi:hypothetical protein
MASPMGAVFFVAKLIGCQKHMAITHMLRRIEDYDHD